MVTKNPVVAMGAYCRKGCSKSYFKIIFVDLHFTKHFIPVDVVTHCRLLLRLFSLGGVSDLNS